MARCLGCGKWAGFFKRSHDLCAETIRAAELAKEQVRQQWKTRLLSFITRPGFDFVTLARECAAALTPPAATTMAEQVLSIAVNDMIDTRQQPSLEALAPLAEFTVAFGIAHANIPARGWHRFVMLVTLADLAAGKFPDRVDDPQLGFAYERGERIAWCVGSVQHYEHKTGTTPGVYGGIGLRVAAGMYVHLGSRLSQGTTVEGFVPTTEGNLVVTDRALWYQAPHGVIRIRFDNILSFDCFEDGIGFCATGYGAKNQAFMTGKNEGWFIHGLVTQLAALRK